MSEHRLQDRLGVALEATASELADAVDLLEQLGQVIGRNVRLAGSLSDAGLHELGLLADKVERWAGSPRRLSGVALRSRALSAWRSDTATG